MKSETGTAEIGRRLSGYEEKYNKKTLKSQRLFLPVNIIRGCLPFIFLLGLIFVLRIQSVHAFMMMLAFGLLHYYFNARISGRTGTGEIVKISGMLVCNPAYLFFSHDSRIGDRKIIIPEYWMESINPGGISGLNGYIMR